MRGWMRWWLLATAGVIALGLAKGRGGVFVDGVLIGSEVGFMGCLLFDVLVLQSSRLGPVRRNKRALHTARKNLASGEGSRRQVLWLRVRLYLALRARKGR
jgi:hypothetical protein